MLQDPEGAGDAVEDPFSDEERDTTDDETDAEATSAEEPWCPPIPDTPDDPTENEIAGAADKLETMISLISTQDKFAQLFMTIAAELWLRERIETLETVFQAAARNFTGHQKRNAFYTPRIGFNRPARPALPVPGASVVVWFGRFPVVVLWCCVCVLGCQGICMDATREGLPFQPCFEQHSCKAVAEHVS